MWVHVGTAANRTGPHGTQMNTRMGSYGTVWVHMGIYGRIWAHAGPQFQTIIRTLIKTIVAGHRHDTKTKISWTCNLREPAMRAQ